MLYVIEHTNNKVLEIGTDIQYEVYDSDGGFGEPKREVAPIGNLNNRHKNAKLKAVKDKDGKWIVIYNLNTKIMKLPSLAEEDVARALDEINRKVIELVETGLLDIAKKIEIAVEEIEGTEGIPLNPDSIFN